MVVTFMSSNTPGKTMMIKLDASTTVTFEEQAN